MKLIITISSLPLQFIILVGCFGGAPWIFWIFCELTPMVLTTGFLSWLFLKLNFFPNWPGFIAFLEIGIPSLIITYLIVCVMFFLINLFRKKCIFNKKTPTATF